MLNGAGFAITGATMTTINGARWSLGPELEALGLARFLLYRFSTEITRKETPGHFREEDRQQGAYQMEMMFVLGGLMSMMVSGLLLQHSVYRRIKVTVK